LFFVCTGNVCRSPTAERLTMAFAEAERVALTASSAGTHAMIGHSVEPNAALVLAGLGASAERFTARQLMVEDIETADLILTMARHHRDAVLRMSPRALSRTFTLREAADLVARMPPAAPHLGQGMTSHGRFVVSTLAGLRAERAAALNPGMEGGGVEGRDDIEDPMGQTLEHFQAMGDAIAEALLPILGVLSTPPVSAWNVG
jgi:protein-tyrosine phosphatase